MTRSDHQTKGKNNSCCRKYSARLNDCWALPSFYFWTSNPLSHEKELGFILGTISLGRHVFPGVRWRSVDECFWLKWLKKLQINKRKPIKVGFVDPTNKLSTHFWANSQIFVPRHCNFFIKITFKQHTTLYWFSHSQGCLVRLMDFLDQQRIPTKNCKKKKARNAERNTILYLGRLKTTISLNIQYNLPKFSRIAHSFTTGSQLHLDSYSI